MGCEQLQIDPRIEESFNLVEPYEVDKNSGWEGRVFLTDFSDFIPPSIAGAKLSDLLCINGQPYKWGYGSRGENFVKKLQELVGLRYLSMGRPEHDMLSNDFLNYTDRATGSNYLIIHDSFQKEKQLGIKLYPEIFTPINRAESAFTVAILFNNKPELLVPNNEFFFTVQAGKGYERLIKVNIKNGVILYICTDKGGFNTYIDSMNKNKNVLTLEYFQFLEKANNENYETLIKSLEEQFNLINLILSSNYNLELMLNDKDYLISSLQSIISSFDFKNYVNWDKFNEKIKSSNNIFEILYKFRGLLSFKFYEANDISEGDKLNPNETEKNNLIKISELFKFSKNDLLNFSEDNKPSILKGLMIAKQFESVLKCESFQNLTNGITYSNERVEDSIDYSIYNNIEEYYRLVIRRVIERFDSEGRIITRVKLPKAINDYYL